MSEAFLTVARKEANWLQKEAEYPSTKVDWEWV
jgi:hypothetical protein